MLDLGATVEDKVATTIGALVAAELEHAAASNDFGIIVQDVGPVDPKPIVDLLAFHNSRKAKSLRVSLVGQDDLVTATPELRDVLTASEEAAVAWRNKRLRTIAVVADGPLSKAASMRDFRVVGETELISRLCEQQRDAAEVKWLRTFWEALQRGHRLRLSLVDVVRFANALSMLPAAARSAAAPVTLHLLGLFPDAHLADDKTEGRILKRLFLNQDVAAEVRRADNEQWARVRARCRTLQGPQKGHANMVLRQLKAVALEGSFEGLDLKAVLDIWRAKGGTSNGLGGGTAGRRIKVERVIGKMLMGDDTDRLGDIADEIDQAIEAVLDDENQGGSQPVRQASDTDVSASVDIDRNLVTLVRSRSTADELGGIIEVSTDKPATLTDTAAFKAWTPFAAGPIIEGLRSFVAEGLASPTTLDLFNRFLTLRLELVPHVASLSISPVATLAGRPEVAQAAEGYLKAYEDLLRQISGCYPDMHAAADYEAEQVLGRLLGLELYVYRAGPSIEAVISPLNPLQLWRTVTMVREVKGLGRSLSEHEVQTLEEACAEDLLFLPVLILTRQATGQDQTMMLGHAGYLGRLPIFREAPRGMLEQDGVRTVVDLARRLAMLRPYVRKGLQVVLVNPPKPGRFIADLVRQLDLDEVQPEGAYSGLHVRVRYTSQDTHGWGNDLSGIEDEDREVLVLGEERGLLSVSLQPEVGPWALLLEELDKKPAHITVVFDPFEVRSSVVARAQTHALSPWLPSREYRFNRIRKEIQVIPVAEEHVFGSYLTAAAHVHTALLKKSPIHLPQVREMEGILDRIAQASTWTLVADPHRVSLARLGGSEVIDRRTERGRQVTCFAHDLAPFSRRLDEQLRKTHFLADADTLSALVRDLVAMEPNGILGLANSSQDRHVKGALGKLIAVRWYRTHQPSGLAVSLDTQEAGRWLVAGPHSREKADLLGLREVEDGLVIDVLEVKAHDEAVPYAIVDGRIDGHAVGQVVATLHALAEVFSTGSVSPLAKPRREVLREHLYTALQRDQDPTFMERWHTLLQDAFDGKVPVKLAARIVHVQLASVAPKESQTYVTRGGVPITVDTLSAHDVGLVLRPVRPELGAGPVRSMERGVDSVLAWTDADTLIMRLTAEQTAASVGEIQDCEDEASQAADVTDPEVSDSRNLLADPSVGIGTVLPAPTSSAEAPRLLEVRFGTEHVSSLPVSWAPGRQSNGFFLILGASGSGKTETLKVLGTSVAQNGIPVLVFDFHGDVRLPSVPSVLLSSGSASTMGLNPMELDISSAEESGLYDQRASLRGMIQRAVPALGHRQSNILREAFDEAYQRAGIDDNDSTTWSRPAPTFRTVEDILREWADDDARKAQRAAIEGCLAAVQELFGHPIFQRKKHVSVEQMLTASIRLDFSKLPDHVRFVATETLLRKLFRVLRLRGPIPVQPADDRQRFRIFVVIDEAKILSLGGGDRDRANNILNELITEARKFGLGMIIASQMSEHFSEEVRANAATWLVLKPMNMTEAKKNAPNVSVDPEDLMRLNGKGDGYFRDRSTSRARRIQVLRLEL